MAELVKVLGLEKTIAKLRDKAAKSIKDDNVSVVVGYQTNYAIYVHEILTNYHPVGQAKFLEQPLRENRNKYGQLLTKVVQNGGTLAQGLVMAGLALQRDSQLLVPVDTGQLKNSAFTRLDRGLAAPSI